MFKEILLILLKSVIEDKKMKILRTALMLIFDAIDADKDSGITKEEFRYFFLSLNIDDKNISDWVFSAIDEDGNESLDQDCKFLFLFEKE